MFNKLLHNLIDGRHRFRHMTFDELSELYTSMMFRSLAMSMAGIFIPIFLYQRGYEVWEIMSFYAVVFGVQFVCTYPVARLIAWIGPKHTILISYILQVITMAGLINIVLLPSHLIIAVLFGMANIAFFESFHINFSKVKHRRSSGSEVGWMFITERTGAILGPLLGGLVAFLFAPEYTFFVSVCLLLFASLPLFLTQEQIKLNQRVDFSKLNVKKIKHDLVSYSGLTVENVVAVVVWPLFLGMIVLANNPYLQLGSIMTVSILVSLFVARAMGKIVDNRRGRTLLRVSAAANGLLHLFRPFTGGYPMALAVNAVNDGVTPGYRMPFLKGFYDAADDHPGSRIVYVAIMEFAATLARAMFFATAAVAAYLMTVDRIFFGLLFLVGAICSFIIMKERFRALNAPKRRIHAK